MTEPKMLHSEVEAFKKAVAVSKGKVVVLVHPFFMRRNPERLEQEFGISTTPEEVEAHHQRIRTLISKAKAPVVVLEEGFNIYNTHDLLKAPNALYVPTFSALPVPFSGWDYLSEFFKSAKVKTVLVAGTYNFSPTEMEKAKLNRRLQGKQLPNGMYGERRGCVGETVAAMKAMSFKRVRILPSLVFPHRECH